MPSPLMQQLMADHRNFDALVEILERQTERLSSGEWCDLEVVEVILAYLQRYGDQCHHPREGLIYERLRALDADAAERAAAVTREHAWLHDNTHRLLTEVRRGCDGERLDETALSRDMTLYVAAHREHMYDENQTLFPFAIERFGASDWAAIEQEARLLAGAERALRIQDRFVALRDYIHRLDRLDPR